MARILVVDDDRPVRRFVRITLGANGHEVIEAESLGQGLGFCGPQPPEVMVLGAAYGGGERLQAVRWAIDLGVRAVIALRLSVGDAEERLDPEVELCVAKPFSIGDLKTQVRAALHQDEDGEARDVLQFANVRMDFLRHVITKSGKEVRLSGREYDILLCLAANHDHVIPEDRIVITVWGASGAENVRRLRLYIIRLREKLEIHPLLPRLLTCEPGVGYRLHTAALGGNGRSRRFRWAPPPRRKL